MNQESREQENFETFQFDKEPEDLWNNFLQESYNKTSLRKLLPQTSSSKSMILQRQPTETYKNDRKWKVLLSSSKVLFDMDQQPFSASIEVRTRNETSPYSVPEKLYSSLKYELTQELPAHCLGTNISVLMSKIQAVNPYNTNEEILKPNSKPILMGTQDFIPLTLSQGSFYSKNKIQFTDVSYHHEKKYFAFKVSYYEPTNLEEPLLVQLSSPFQVFARRPRKNIKRRNSISTSKPQQQTKRIKKETTMNTIKKEEFIKKEEQLLLKQEQQQQEEEREQQEEEEEEEQQKQQQQIQQQFEDEEEQQLFIPNLDDHSMLESSASTLNLINHQYHHHHQSPIQENNKLNQFLEYLDILAKFKEDLTEEEKKIAKENVEKKLLDREFSSFENLTEFDLCSMDSF